MAKIEKTKSGKYRTRVYIGEDADGKKHWKSITHPDKVRLQRLAAVYADSHRSYAEYNTFAECANTYIGEKTPVLSPSTIRSYLAMFGTLNAKYTWFCELTLDKVDKQSMQKLINGLVTDDRSPKYIRNMHGFCTAVMRNNDYQPPIVRLPEPKKPDYSDLSKEEVSQLISASEGSELHIPILLGVHGLRIGEVCALSYPNSFKDGYVHVGKSLARAIGGGFIEKQPKNQTSDRYVPIDESLLSEIEKQGYITKYSTDTLSHKFSKFAKATLGRSVRFHDLRHFFASYMHDQGFSDAQIMKMGGWATDSIMKRVYRYALNDKSTNQRVAESLSKSTFM